MPKLTRTDADFNIWIPKTILHECAVEASDKFPLETGGTFMGWWSNETEAVITAIIGPGPNAIHERHHFQPDQEWQLEQIANHYRTSGKVESYIGDWHSHPGASSGGVCCCDYAVLRRIITTPSARCSNPLMMVLWNKPDDWYASIWRASLQHRPIIWDRVTLNHANLKPS